MIDTTVLPVPRHPNIPHIPTAPPNFQGFHGECVICGKAIYRVGWGWEHTETMIWGEVPWQTYMPAGTMAVMA